MIVFQDRRKFAYGLPRWKDPEQLLLVPKGTVFKSNVDGFYYHPNPAGRHPEVRGPYRTRSLCVEAFRAFKDEMEFELKEVREAVTKGRTGERWSQHA